MSYILHIDCAQPEAYICLCRDGKALSVEISNQQKEHASFVHSAISNLLDKAGIKKTDLDAISVSAGPGSYTGLRVGFSSAKGLCYALEIPLITLSSLEILARAVIKEDDDPATKYWPMIDARRNEVYTALYYRSLSEILPAMATDISSINFENFLRDSFTKFCGSGIVKLPKFPGFKYELIAEPDIISAAANLSIYKFLQKEFADLAYSEPLYIKDFHDSKVK